MGSLVIATVRRTVAIARTREQTKVNCAWGPCSCPVHVLSTSCSRPVPPPVSRTTSALPLRLKPAAGEAPSRPAPTPRAGPAGHAETLAVTHGRLISSWQYQGAGTNGDVRPGSVSRPAPGASVRYPSSAAIVADGRETGGGAGQRAWGAGRIGLRGRLRVANKHGMEALPECGRPVRMPGRRTPAASLQHPDFRPHSGKQWRPFARSLVRSWIAPILSIDGRNASKRW